MPLFFFQQNLIEVGGILAWGIDWETQGLVLGHLFLPHSLWSLLGADHRCPVPPNWWISGPTVERILGREKFAKRGLFRKWKGFVS